jgi:hypothetical protein
MSTPVSKLDPPDEFKVSIRHTTPSIWVTFAKIGFHRYPDAPEEVAYLRNEHRHEFQFRVEITVFHDDREIEFHMFKNWLLSLYDQELKVDYKSCEMLAMELLNKVLDKYNCDNRSVEVTVSEDGECGSTVLSHPRYSVPLNDAIVAAYERHKQSPGSEK